MKTPLLLFFVLCATCLQAQNREVFDITSFSPPAGWSREANSSVVSFVKVNNKTGSWCRLSVYKSIGSSGDLTTDFDHEWNDLIVKNFEGTTKPVPDVTTEGGWTAQSGVSTFTWQGKESYALLNVISGYGRTLSISVTMNSQEYMKAIESFLGTLELSKPEGYQEPQQVQQVAPVVNNTATISVTDAPGKHGITKSTTNFDDGWVAQPFADYVKVTKGPITVLLHYGIEVTDEMRSNNNVEGTLFDRVILPRYTVSNIRKYANESYCYYCIYFFEADAVEKATGKKCHVGFRIITNNGVSSCIEIISPSADAFNKEFTDQKKVEGMLNYNKFAITQADLIGTWEESGGSYVNMYSTVTGAYAGMNAASSAHTFVFNADGTYSSHHRGGYGMVGSMNIYDQKYNGNYSFTNWDITMTKRWDGKTENFWAQFEAVRGGRILYINDKAASAMRYSLAKTK
ncbi:MAG: hypothetical protein UZ12_BCD005001961 [Bacteroidetes bacterium OLB12]|nr:MAG: hypothetical protein UZ12_BCD005001961 [Bacteroidetes bacterium OLB12]HNR72793.1 hypothetical protein [Cyclobacteriaceae bacterium]HNU41217.1 hypothetical protein [Cyclobacteriaceae bacterium]